MVIINGWDSFPTNCYDCDLNNYHECFLTSNSIEDYTNGYTREPECPLRLEYEKPIIYCRDCKWWKESDGTYNRGLRAESKCLMNTMAVYAGNGYCYLAEPKTVKGENE